MLPHVNIVTPVFLMDSHRCIDRCIAVMALSTKAETLCTAIFVCYGSKMEYCRTFISKEVFLSNAQFLGHEWEM